MRFWKSYESAKCDRTRGDLGYTMDDEDEFLDTEDFEALPIKSKTITRLRTERIELPENDYGFTRMFVTYENYVEPTEERPPQAGVSISIFTEDGSELFAETELSLGEILSCLHFPHLSKLKLDFLMLKDITSSYIIVGEVKPDFEDDDDDNTVEA